MFTRKKKTSKHITIKTKILTIKEAGGKTALETKNCLRIHQ